MSIIKSEIRLSHSELIYVKDIADKYRNIYNKYYRKVLEDKIDVDGIINEMKLDIDKGFVEGCIEHIKEYAAIKKRELIENKAFKTFRVHNRRILYDQIIIDGLVFTFQPVKRERDENVINYYHSVAYAPEVKLMLIGNRLIASIDTALIRCRPKGAH